MKDAFVRLTGWRRKMYKGWMKPIVPLAWVSTSRSIWIQSICIAIINIKSCVKIDCNTKCMILIRYILTTHYDSTISLNFASSYMYIYICTRIHMYILYVCIPSSFCMSLSTLFPFLDPLSLLWPMI